MTDTSGTQYFYEPHRKGPNYTNNDLHSDPINSKMELKRIQIKSLF